MKKGAQLAPRSSSAVLTRGVVDPYPMHDSPPSVIRPGVPRLTVANHVHPCC